MPNLADQISHIQTQLARKYKTLHFLEEQAAKYTALDLPVHKFHELQDTQAEIETLETELAELKERATTAPPAGGAMKAAAPANPFGDTGRITDPARFFDREDLLRRCFEALGKGVNLSLVGQSQIGKSSVLAMLCAQGPARLHVPVHYLSLEWLDDEHDFYEALCDTLEIPTCRGYKLTRALRGRRCVLCLDEMEKMAWDGFTVTVRSHLRGLADGAAAPLTLVIASRSPLGRLFPDSPELASPLAGICRQLDVGPFPADVSRAFLRQRLEPAGFQFSPAEIETLLAQSQGHPAKLQRAAARLFRQYRTPGPGQ